MNQQWKFKTLDSKSIDARSIDVDAAIEEGNIEDLILSYIPLVLKLSKNDEDSSYCCAKLAVIMYDMPAYIKNGKMLSTYVKKTITKGLLGDRVSRGSVVSCSPTTILNNRKSNPDFMRIEALDDEMQVEDELIEELDKCVADLKLTGREHSYLLYKLKGLTVRAIIKRMNISFTTAVEIAQSIRSKHENTFGH